MKFTSTALSLLLLTATLVANDEIFLANGQVRSDVRITEESYTEVTYRNTRGTTQTEPSAEVLRVNYGRSSPEFSVGMSKLGTAEWADGVAKLRSATQDLITSEEAR